jgi:hypothetical protein
LGASAIRSFADRPAATAVSNSTGDLGADELQALDGPLDRFRIEDAPR